VREATIEDLRGKSANRPLQAGRTVGEKQETARMPKPKTRGFIRRIFQRKAI